MNVAGWCIFEKHSSSCFYWIKQDGLNIWIFVLSKLKLIYSYFSAASIIMLFIVWIYIQERGGERNTNAAINSGDPLHRHLSIEAGKDLPDMAAASNLKLGMFNYKPWIQLTSVCF